MPLQLRHLLRGAERLRDLRRGDETTPHDSETSGDEARVRRGTGPQREVEALLDDVRDAVRAEQVHLDLGEEPQVLREDRSEERERHGGGHPEQSAGRRLELRDGELRLLELGDDPNAVLVVDAPHVREAHGPRRALQESRADPRLELGDLPAHGGLRHPDGRCRRREAAALHDPGEDQDLVERDVRKAGVHDRYNLRRIPFIVPSRPWEGSLASWPQNAKRSSLQLPLRRRSLGRGRGRLDQPVAFFSSVTSSGTALKRSATRP